ncbi:putative L-type lectin-domain containing receptor kinase S.5 [Acorus gramineus]|uniref:non-specific serine/threonine protein kinase n=1 Tax=Acorus gramineus TaxID=55184 RepID=A0AAV9ABG4_ACOGR|nr:putative L-type lectin-domain containing receptor kinase S.5 [Acorus gramineus]
MYNGTFKLWKSTQGSETSVATFESTFTLNILPLTNPGGEGMAFIMTNYPELPSDSAGPWLGIVNEKTNLSPLNRIVAVEFDTRKSSGVGNDYNRSHAGVDVDAIYSVIQRPLAQDGAGVNLSSGSDVFVNIRYDGALKNLMVDVSMDNTTVTASRPFISLPIDLSLYLLEDVYVGFSASTSNFTQLNCVRAWSFRSDDIQSGDQPQPELPTRRRAKKNRRFAAFSVVLVIPIGLIIGAFCYKKRWEEPPVQPIPSTILTREFPYEELATATNNFSDANFLGGGASGKVYRGSLSRINREVAIKKLFNDSRETRRAFEAERATIGELFHRNLVRLIGWCSQGDESLLVYEFHRKGSLDRHLYPPQTVGALTWDVRYKIICGVASALDYLHNACERVVLHRDVKPSNVMLDDDDNAKLGDFGLARKIHPDAHHHSTENMAGTRGYMAPECFTVGRVCRENDVYAFGVFAMEVVCGRVPGTYNPNGHTPEGDRYIVYWLWNLYASGDILSARDARLTGGFDEEQMRHVLVLGLASCHPDYERRPTMKDILQVLVGGARPPNVPLERPLLTAPRVSRASLGGVSQILEEGGEGSNN